jgi:hypothetical protein
MRARVIAELRRLIETTYVFPDRRASISAALEQAFKRGELDAADPKSFAEKVSRRLSEAGHDLHLRLEYEPSEFREKIQQRDNRDYSGVMARIRRDHHGYVRQEILPGNVRYVKIANFRWIPEESGRAVEDAVRFLRDADAIVLDLRGNSGGDPRAVQYLISHFFEGVTELAGEYDGSTGAYSPLKTLAELPAGRLGGKPLYVLVDRSTFSAGEEFAYEVQQYGLGRLVGETTAGGANGSRRHPVEGGFIASVPYLRLVHPRTGTNWEGVGVIPDLKASGALALDLALLTDLTRPGRPGGSESLDWTVAALRARVSPVSVPAARLAAYAGQYGQRRIWVSDGSLMYQREGRDPVRLTPLADHLFQLGADESLRVRFVEQGGAIAALEIVTEEGVADTSPRSAAPAP